MYQDLVKRPLFHDGLSEQMFLSSADPVQIWRCFFFPLWVICSVALADWGVLPRSPMGRRSHGGSQQRVSPQGGVLLGCYEHTKPRLCLHFCTMDRRPGLLVVLSLPLSVQPWVWTGNLRTRSCQRCSFLKVMLVWWAKEPFTGPIRCAWGVWYSDVTLYKPVLKPPWSNRG